MTAVPGISAYDAACEYIRISDTLRLYQQAGWPAPASMAEMAVRLRTQLDAALAGRPDPYRAIWPAVARASGLDEAA